MNTGVVITGIGMVTSVGYNAVQTCASIRAGINRFQEPEYFLFAQKLNPFLEETAPLVCSPVPLFKIETPWLDRINQMVQISLSELIDSAKISAKEMRETAIFLALPPVDKIGLPANVVDSILLPLHQNHSFKGIKILPNGHAACYAALIEAKKLLKQSEVKFCIVGGVDSYFDQNILKLFETHNRLKSESNIDGFIPGEAASFFILENMTTATSRKVKALASLGSAGIAFEKNGYYSESPSLGKGLVEAIRKAIEMSNVNREIEWVICDLNGESFRSKEWGTSYSRLGKYFPDFKHMSHPADCLGDIGAASGALSIALAARAFEHGYAPAEKVIVWGASDQGERGAAIFQRVN